MPDVSRMRRTSYNAGMVSFSSAILRSGKCLSAAQFCDGLYDCPDRMDENGCTGPGSERVEVMK